MKKFVCLLVLLSMLLAVGCTNPADQTPPDNAEPDEQYNYGELYEPMNYAYMKAAWISCFDMEDILVVDGAQRDAESFSELIIKMMENIKNEGYNTVIIQVRPYADSFYASDYYPLSRFVCGEYGNDILNYDPFDALVKAAKAQELSVHAWINPMRGMLVEEIASVANEYLIKQWYNDRSLDRVVELNGRIYLNPAYPEVRELIAEGAREVAERYPVDGVHIDEYFYPTTDASFDAKSYQNYLTAENAAVSKTLSEFRYDNLNKLISEIYSAVKSVNKNLLFGISPAGDIKNTYENYYADVYKWCSEDGYLDYICPKIYFGLEHSSFDFKRVFNTWNDIVKNPSVRLVVGMTLTKARDGVDNDAGDGKNEWVDNKDVIKRCYEFLNTQDFCSGISMFSYKYMYDPLSGDSIPETSQERENARPAFSVLN